MSAKIYDVYLTHGLSVFDIMNILKPELLKARKAAEAHEIARTVYANADRKAYGGKFDEEVLGAPEAILSRLPFQTKDIAFDHQQSEVCMLPHPDGGILVKLFGKNNNVTEAFNDIAVKNGWQDYHYQNQTDKPDDITDEEWQQRKSVWNQIFSGNNHSFNDVSVFFKIGSTRPVLDIVNDVDIIDEAFKNFSVGERLMNIVGAHYPRNGSVEDFNLGEWFVKLVEVVNDERSIPYRDRLRLYSYDDVFGGNIPDSHDISSQELETLVKSW